MRKTMKTLRQMTGLGNVDESAEIFVYVSLHCLFLGNLVNICSFISLPAAKSV
jgi:hypothetical protein